MAKKIILAVIAVFVAWEVLDLLIHTVILSGAYQATSNLWRPEAEMKMGLMFVVTLLSAIFFVLLYALLVANKGAGAGIKYGLLFGLATGISMGYGTYSVMPIPYGMAFTWFLGSVIEATVAGWLVGVIVKEGEAPPAQASAV